MKERDPVATVGDGICVLLPQLRRFARAIAGHPADADDLLQVAIERALRHAAQWRPQTPLQYWLFGIIRHAWLDEVRAQQRRRQLFVGAAEGDQVGDSPLERQQEWMAVQAALARLPDEQRWPIALVLIEGLSYRDAATVLDIPIGTLTSRLARGREALQALLEEHTWTTSTNSPCRPTRTVRWRPTRSGGSKLRSQPIRNWPPPCASCNA